jgi:hypothetical protein
MYSNYKNRVKATGNAMEVHPSITYKVTTRLTVRTQYIRTRLYLTYIHLPEHYSYEGPDSRADYYTGKTLSELEDGLAVLMEDGSVPSSGQVAVAIVW